MGLLFTLLALLACDATKPPVVIADDSGCVTREWVRDLDGDCDDTDSAAYPGAPAQRPARARAATTSRTRTVGTSGKPTATSETPSPRWATSMATGWRTC
jgi:hypothetical protein